MRYKVPKYATAHKKSSGARDKFLRKRIKRDITQEAIRGLIITLGTEKK